MSDSKDGPYGSRCSKQLQGMGRWGSLLGEVTCEFRHLGGAGSFLGEKGGEGYQEEAPDLKGPMLTGAEKFRMVGGTLCRGWGCGWGCETSLERGRWQKGEKSLAAPCGVIVSLDSGASPAGFTSQPCRENS